jgi:crotonobetaine/carnitine-CoA ligase
MDFPGRLTVGHVVEQRARTHGEKPFLVFENGEGIVESVSYATLERETRKIAAGLAARGVAKGDRVLLMLRNSVECVLAMFACARAGFVSVPVNTASVAPELRHVLDLVEPVAFVAQHEYAQIVLDAWGQSGSARLGVVVGDWDQGATDIVPWQRLATSSAANIDDAASSDDLMQILMTSGTTSRPKAVMHTHANRLRSGYRVALHNRLRPDDRSLTPFPAFHVNAIDGTLAASLVSGGTAVLLERFSSSRFWEQVCRHRATMVPLLPTVIRGLLSRPPSQTDREHSIRVIGTGLQLSEAELEEFVARFGIPLVSNGYGLTEACTGVLGTLLEGPQPYPSIGVPIFDREVELRDESGVPVQDGEIGEICVRGVPGRSIMAGYFVDDAATSEAIRDGWLHTGDLAWQDDEGYFYFASRRKDMIKRAGENVAAQEVETVLGEHPAILEAAVIGVPDSYRDEAVKAYLVLESDASIDLEAVSIYCSGRLAAFKIPTAIEIVPDLPRGLLGKVDKEQLRQRERRDETSGE